MASTTDSDTTDSTYHKERTDHKEYLWTTSLIIRQETGFPGPLGSELNVDGNHVWIPPQFKYSEYTGETQEKILEAVLEFTNGDRAKATRALDVQDELSLLETYIEWVKRNRYHGSDRRMVCFFTALWCDLIGEMIEVEDESREVGIRIIKGKDGEWTAWDQRKLQELELDRELEMLGSTLRSVNGGAADYYAVPENVDDEELDAEAEALAAEMGTEDGAEGSVPGFMRDEVL